MIIKINTVRGDLSGISAKMATLLAERAGFKSGISVTITIGFTFLVWLLLFSKVARNLESLAKDKQWIDRMEGSKGVSLRDTVDRNANENTYNSPHVPVNIPMNIPMHPSASSFVDVSDDSSPSKYPSRQLSNLPSRKKLFDDPNYDGRNIRFSDD